MENSPVIPSADPAAIETTQIQNNFDPSDTAASIHRKPNKNYWKAATLCLSILVILCGSALAYLLMKKPASVVTQAPVVQPSPALIATTDAWNTYFDPKSRFSFKYPQNLTYKPLANNVDANAVVMFQDDQGTKFDLTGFAVYSQSQYDTFLKEDSGFFKDVKTFTDSQNRTWNTYIALGEVYNFTAVFKQNNTYYVVNLQSGPGFLTNPSNDGSLFRDFADQILSTFKFGDQAQTDTTNWKTYTEKTSGVTFKYPETWYVQSLLLPSSSGSSSWSDLEFFLDDRAFEIPRGTEFSTPIQARFGYMSTDPQTGTTTLIKTIAETAKWLRTNVYGSNVTETDNLIIGGHKAIQLSGEAGPGMLEGQKFKYTLIQMDDNVFIFSLENSPNFESIYDQMITTVRFTSPVSTVIK